MQDLNGQVAVITGGSSGIGLETGRRLVAAGAIVYSADLNPPPAEPAGGAARIRFERCDIGDADEVDRVAGAIVAEQGRIDLLVNSAGVISTLRPMERIPTVQWNTVLNVNVTGAFFWIRAVLPGMKERRHGAIVNISSRAGRTIGNHAGVDYATSKAALLGLTRQVAYEAAAHGVRVNAVAPGLVTTPLIDDIPDERLEAARLAHPMRRHGTVGDVAEAVLFLLSSRSGYTTGSTIDVNGGELIL